ncbi:hypothetical protein QE152_g22250 [Popillia japonica]|uniref:Reverse transcriptase n=1 Tax=Popillia japonica TaxID=7064 RepID=A0AAW1KLK0_POPJA
MLAANVIRPSHSSYSSPVVIVPKKNGEPRFCVDFRRLNDRTHDEASPLPPIHEALRDLGAASVDEASPLLNPGSTKWLLAGGTGRKIQALDRFHDAGWCRIRIPGHAFWTKGRRFDDARRRRI